MLDRDKISSLKQENDFLKKVSTDYDNVQSDNLKLRDQVGSTYKILPQNYYIVRHKYWSAGERERADPRGAWSRAVLDQAAGGHHAGSGQHPRGLGEGQGCRVMQNLCQRVLPLEKKAPLQELRGHLLRPLQ